MKLNILLCLLLLIKLSALCQVTTADTIRIKTLGIKNVDNATKIDPQEVLDKYEKTNIYKIYIDEHNEEIIKIGPANSDLGKSFSEKLANNKQYHLNDLSGINYAGIKALYTLSIDLNEKISLLEESQNIISKQAADLAEMQNNLLRLMGEIEELKQANTDLKNDLNNFKIEINTKQERGNN